MKKNKKLKKTKIKYKYEKISILFLIFIVIVYLIINRVDKNSSVVKYENINVEINEEVVLKEYTKNKREIDNITFDDYRILELSKKKIESILEYKSYMGQINEIKELENIPHITKKDLDKLKKVFKDTNIKKYKKHNINTISKKELKYLGFSDYDIKKIITYRKKYKIKNLIELENIIGDKYNLKNIEF